jgi:hypothetical protein
MAHATSTGHTTSRDLVQQLQLSITSFHALLWHPNSLCWKCFMTVATPTTAFENVLAVLRARQ